MVKLLMPKATAVWLIDNTKLTFQQIADFCGLHILEIQSIADGEVAKNIQGVDPVISGQLTAEEIERCERNVEAKLKLAEVSPEVFKEEQREKGRSKYVPVARRNDKPDGIMWLLKNCPELSIMQIGKLVGATKNTVESVQNRTHWNSANIKPKDPVLLGLCSQSAVDAAVAKGRKKMEKEQKNEDASENKEGLQENAAELKVASGNSVNKNTIDLADLGLDS